MKFQNISLWSDNWWIENNRAWFISEEEQILCQYDFTSNKCSALSLIPVECANKGRLYSRCVKNDMDIICIPDRGSYILSYSLQNGTWESVEVNNPNNERIAGVQFEKMDNCLIIFAKGLKKLIKYNLITKEIICYINVSNDVNELLGFGMFFNNLFYAVSRTFSRIYECNITTQEVRTFDLPNIEDELNTICYKKGSFIICGKKKKIYLWDKENKKLDTIQNFPPEFGEYIFDTIDEKVVDCNVQEYKERTFYSTMLVGRCVWFIPFQTNKILFLDTVTNKLNEFVILDEEETETSLKNNILGHKYLVEYIRENRYIGLYSLKNEYMIEIDSDKLNYRIVPFDFDNSCIEIFENKIFTEVRKMDTIIYTEIIRDFQCNKMGKNEKIGSKIYFSINSSK